MIRHEFEDYPPMDFLKLILDAKSEIYLFLWKHKDNLNRFMMSWKDIDNYYDKRTFCDNLRKLVKSGLISYIKDKKGVSVEVVGWDDIDNS